MNEISLIKIRESGIESYLENLEKDLNEFENKMIYAHDLDKDNFFLWFLTNNDVIKNYLFLTNNVEFDTKEDTLEARKKTFIKYVKALNKFYELCFDVKETFRI